ncbi:EcsC family protein [uncultured Thiohalocapsa sp.]|uniref:EcsC family protein n=1 Tax=uncultured Thiohalocapsa sp. TaxID=768990 RepID=UPI0025F5E0D1|nr:EcsC family protein [uncultured Thiohalocapsa sp.]
MSTPEASTAAVDRRDPAARQLVAAGLPAYAARELAWAYERLEHPSLAARLSDVLASPFEEAMKLIPRRWKQRLDHAVETNMYRTLKMAMGSMDQREPMPSSDLLHRALVTGTGAVGGFFGPLTVLAELPVATALMMRSIADIARSEGEDIMGSREARLACVQVFALGGRTKDDDEAEVGYYGMRITLGLHFENLLEFAGKVDGPHVPAAIQLARAVAARFGVVISDKLAAQLVPVAGALSAATLNLIFMQHYQTVARGHFIVRRLERDYGAQVIRDAYSLLREQDRLGSRDFSPIEGW